MAQIHIGSFLAKKINSHGAGALKSHNQPAPPIKRIVKLNSNKIILDLCGGSGSWVKPYRDAGYDVRTITLPENDVRIYIPPKNVYGVVAAPPCESFSNARRGHKIINQSMDVETGWEIVNACLRIIKECNPVFWALENPAAGELKQYLGEPTMVFQPYEFGDGWAKKTALWGNFNIPKKIYCAKNRPVALPGLYIRPGRGYPSLAFQHKSAIKHIPQFAKFADYIKSDYDIRSITPPGFAKAFFDANQ